MNKAKPKKAKQLIKEVKVKVSQPPVFPCEEKMSKFNWAFVIYFGVFAIVVYGLIHWLVHSVKSMESAEQGQQVEIQVPLREVS